MAYYTSDPSSFPEPIDLSHHLSRSTKAREASSVKRFYKYFSIPGIAQLAGGGCRFIRRVSRLTAVRATKRQVLPLRHPRSQGLAPQPMEAHAQQARRPARRRSAHRPS